MPIDPKLIDQLIAEHGHRPEDIAGETGLLKQLTKAVLERAMQAEMTNHLGYEKHDPAGYKSGNSRNGKSHKKLTGEFGETLKGASSAAISLSLTSLPLSADSASEASSAEPTSVTSQPWA